MHRRLCCLETHLVRSEVDVQTTGGTSCRNYRRFPSMSCSTLLRATYSGSSSRASPPSCSHVTCFSACSPHGAPVGPPPTKKPSDVRDLPIEPCLCRTLVQRRRGSLFYIAMRIVDFFNIACIIAVDWKTLNARWAKGVIPMDEARMNEIIRFQERLKKIALIGVPAIIVAISLYLIFH
jgi:hypothetical protein